MSPVYNELREALLPRYEAREARAVALLVLEDAFGVSRTDVYADKVRHFSEEERCLLQNILQRLAAGEPVQYVLGRASFCGMSLRVTPATLIPRPETAELVDAAEAMAREWGEETPLRVLDGGTGSGCIAIVLASRLRHAAVEAWDVSDAALNVARHNAVEQGVSVDFRHRDLLAPESSEGRFHLIVSNPPYVTERERGSMAAHVLDYEPHTALFVPDDDPLRFYRALAQLGRRSLLPHGALAVEINQAFGPQTTELFRNAGLTDVTLRRDAYGHDRIVTARQPH